MSAEHTPGLIREGLWGGSIVSDNPAPGMPGNDEVRYYGGHMIAESITPANRRRIIACWNACEDISTEALEEDEAPRKIREDRDQLLRERADLLTALEGVLAIVGDSRGVAGYHLNGEVAEWDEFPEVGAAREAVAKAKGR